MRLPKLCRNKSRNRAFVLRDQQRIYLGPWGAPETDAAYRRYISELTSDKPPVPDSPKQKTVSVAELAAAYLDAHADYYVKLGKQTRQLGPYKAALEFAVEFFPATPIDEFGPGKLTFCRDEMERSGRFARTYVNTLINCLRHVVKWGVGRELVAATTLVGLRSVEPLKIGKSTARETDSIEPVPAADVDATLPFLPSTVAAMIRIQRFTGTRPGEVCAMRFGDLDFSGEIWIYSLRHDKTEARRKSREKKKIALGRRAQAVLTPFLIDKEVDADAFLFSPRDAARDRERERRRNRKSPLTPSQIARDAATKTRRYNDYYTEDLYGKIVRKASEKAGVKRWSPNRLRHLFATEIRAQFGLETAQIMLGHAKADVTQIYAERDFEKMRRVAAEVG